MMLSKILYLLAQHPEVQERLRTELQQISTDTPTLDMLNTCSFLDHVVRETVRLYSAVAFVTREAMEDDVIPLGTPIQDRHGRTLDHIK